FDFSVVEDDTRENMLLAAREAVLAEGIGLEGAVETLFRTLSDDQIRKSIADALGDGRKLKTVLQDPARAKANLRRLVGAGNRSSSDVEAELKEKTLLSAISCRDMVAVFGGDPLKTTGARLVDMLARCNPELITPGELRRLFLTDKGPRSRLLTAAQQAQRPDLFDLLTREQDRVVQLDAELRQLELVERSEAFLEILGAIHHRYENAKRRQSNLDFDDLVERLADLFEREAGEWVRYKLDAGIDHILVDESQDTNGEQWRVVKAITAEFFAGAGAVTRPRSLFAVGDQKQSIYSFQGAQPELFGETGQLYKRLAREADAPFLPVPLRTSFRTLPEILKAVDLVTDSPAMRSALLENEPVEHQAARTMRGGTVTLWPPVQQPAGTAPAGEWPTTVPPTEQTAPRRVAERIAAEISGWIREQRPLTGRGRPVRADDVLILVQSRGPLFAEIIRALRKWDLPTPGADRLGVTSHIAVMDLLALCDVLLNPADDLQLAALLRSPLFDITEADLFGLSHGRERGQTLWQALSQCPISACAQAYERLHRWRGELDFERPFEFLAQVLYADDGLARFHARLGTEVDDVLGALLELALAHEQTDQPSLLGFVAAMRGLGGTVKRELPEAGAGVRIMTVHGAKGLEAPIVILADAVSKPRPQQVGKSVYLVTESPGPLLVHATGSNGHLPQTTPLKQGIDANLLNEYWRKLYVGMTRAEDELYVTGALTAGTDAAKQLEGSWYAAIELALRPLSQSILDADGIETALVYPRERSEAAVINTAGAARTAAATRPPLPPLPPYHAVPTVTPAGAGTRGAPRTPFSTALEGVRDAQASRREGIALHALLQHLGSVEPALWPQVVPKAAAALLPEAPERQPVIGAKAVSILSRPELAHLFGPNGRAEVPFLLDALQEGQPIRLAGRIDRLVVGADGVLVVDFKSDAGVPG
ncbi:MAG: addA, partial [Devosia sp.]|nr:addA [Devosia sp.]